MRPLQFVRRVFWEIPTAESLVDLAPDVARTLMRAFLVLGMAGMACGPVLDVLWHRLDPAHAAWYAFDWVNLGALAVWAVCLWATYLLPLYPAVIFSTSMTIVTMTVAVFLSGGIDSPNVITYAVPILMGVLFLGLRDSLVITLVCCGAYFSVYVLEVHVGLVAPRMEHGNMDITHAMILTSGIVIIWLMAWMISASLRFPLYDRIRTNSVQQAQISERERLLAIVSHELRTPLTNIVGFVEMIRGHATGLDPDIRQGLHANALQLLTTVNNMLDYSKSQQAAQSAAVEPVLVPAVADELLRMFSPALTRQNTSGEIHQDPMPFPWLQLDRFALERILTNLVSNAVKHTRNGRVLVDLSWHAGQLTIKVADTGTGMSAETLARVFEPFFHDASTGVAGTGLGMALVHQMVTRMGGQIAVASEPGLGTSVTLTVPAAATAEPIRVAAPESVRLQPADTNSVYLFVEDQPDIRALIAAFAQVINIRATIVGSVSELPLTVDTLSVAFVDLQLAGSSGVEVLDRLKALRPQLPVWAMTANMMFRPEEPVSTGRRFDGVLYKPFTMQQLQDAINAARG